MPASQEIVRSWMAALSSTAPNSVMALVFMAGFVAQKTGRDQSVGRRRADQVGGGLALV
jgi:hypothetical protein